MATLSFFDAHLTLGRTLVPRYHFALDGPSLKSELADFLIRGGLVRHAYSLEFQAAVGNQLLSEMIDGVDGYEALWAVVPHWTGELPPPDELIRNMAANRVRAAAMYPTTYGFSMRKSVIGPMLDVLCDARVPLFLSGSEATLSVVEDTAKAYPALPIILCDTSYRLARDVYALFTTCPNIYAETSSFMVHMGFEDVTERFGSERLVFGSRYPLYNPGAAVAAVLYAEIPDEAKADIAGDNLKRLLAEVKI